METVGVKRLLLWAIDVYRRFVSPLLPESCRFTPTCSTYARTAVDRYGAIKGARLAIARILRCNPWNRGGYDPVPEDEHNADE